MKEVTDRLYGKFEIEAVLQEVIESPAFVKLKGIHTGAGAYLVNDSWDVTRYDHSIGTMILAKILGGSLEEQLKALLHDIAHTTFSHVIDYVLENEAENYHDEIQEKLLAKTTIPAILQKFGFAIDTVLEMPYVVLDADLPALSIDRIDYTLRDMERQKVITLEEISDFVASLCVTNEIVCTKDIKAAVWFSELYKKEVTTYFQHPVNVYGNTVLTEILQTALKNAYISLADFLVLEDDALVAKITRYQNSQINQMLDQLQAIKEGKAEILPIEKSVQGKKRVIDPDICLAGKKVALSVALTQK